jgi:hypothetical protein
MELEHHQLDCFYFLTFYLLRFYHLADSPHFRPRSLMKTAYVQCSVLPGLFDTELYVLVNGSSAAYVNRNSVKIKADPQHGVQVDGEVFAYIINQRDDQSLVELTGEPVVGGLRTWVPNAMLAST